MLSLAILFLSQLPSVSQPQSTPPREEAPPDLIGYEFSGIHDLDGDGCSELMVVDGVEAWIVSGRTFSVLLKNGARPWVGPVCESVIIGDVDLDGVADFASRYRWPSDRRLHFDLELLSGRDGHRIRALSFPGGGDIGIFASAGDADGDGIPDVAVVGTGGSSSLVAVFSGRDGRLLRSLEGAAILPERVDAIVGWDFDGDGCTELLLSQPPNEQAGVPGSVKLFSVGDGCSIATFRDANRGRRSIKGMGTVGDADGDGWEDVVIVSGSEPFESRASGLPESRPRESSSGSAAVFTTRGGSWLCTLEPCFADEMCDEVHVARLGDLDRDGVADFAIAYDRWWDFGRVVVHSGKSGRMIREHSPDERVLNQQGGRFGVAVVSLGDLDDDGIEDYAIGSSGGIDRLYPGCISVWSGATGMLLHALWKKDLLK